VVVCSTELRLGLLLVATAASVSCIDPSQPQNSHKAAHIGAGANKKTRRNMPGTPTAHACHAYRDSARPQRTHAPSQAWTEASPICHASASAVSSRKERAAEKIKKNGSRGTGGECRRVQGRGRFASTGAGAAVASGRGGGEADRWRRHAVRGAWAVASAAAVRVGGGETPGRPM